MRVDDGLLHASLARVSAHDAPRCGEPPWRLWRHGCTVACHCLQLPGEALGIRPVAVEGRRLKATGAGLPQSLPAIVGYGSRAAMTASLQCFKRKTGRPRRRLPPLAVFSKPTVIGFVGLPSIGKRACLVPSDPRTAMATWRRHGKAAAVVTPRPCSFRAKPRPSSGLVASAPGRIGCKARPLPVRPAAGRAGAFRTGWRGPCWRR